MAQIPVRVAERLATGLKRFQPILQSARTRDVNESDTSIIVTDTLSDLLGYDKYSEVTREHCIRGTFCDLAIKLEDKLQFIIEVKAIGLELKDAHVKQAVDYAANQGVDWTMLTNGVEWRIFKVTYSKPIDHELVLAFDLLKMNHRNGADLADLYNLTREGLLKGALATYQTQQQATSKFLLGALIVSEPLLDTLRREIRRLSPEVKIRNEDLRDVLINEVLKREVVDGEKAEDAKRKVQRAAAKLAKTVKDKATPQPGPASASTPASE